MMVVTLSCTPCRSSSPPLAGGRRTVMRVTPRSRLRFNTSMSSGAPPNVTDSDCGSRPASSAICRRRGMKSSGLRAGARSRGKQPVAVTDRAARGEAEGAADDDRRMRLLHRLGPGHHRWKTDHLAVKFRLVLGPDLLHRLDLLAHLLRAGLVNGAVVFHLFGIPAAADAEQEAALRHLIERGDEVCGLDRVALDHQTDGGAKLE